MKKKDFYLLLFPGCAVTVVGALVVWVTTFQIRTLEWGTPLGTKIYNEFVEGVKADKVHPSSDQWLDAFQGQHKTKESEKKLSVWAAKEVRICTYVIFGIVFCQTYFVFCVRKRCEIAKNGTVLATSSPS